MQDTELFSLDFNPKPNLANSARVERLLSRKIGPNRVGHNGFSNE